MNLKNHAQAPTGGYLRQRKAEGFVVLELV
jgi:hypothetical protein